jgi:hypothetical protein
LRFGPEVIDQAEAIERELVDDHQLESGVMNSSPKQKPLRERTIAGKRWGWGVSNSTSSKSPGFSKTPAYNTIPPSLNSVPRPATTVVAKPLYETTRTGRSTGSRFQRRTFTLGESGIVAHHHLWTAIPQITKGKIAEGRKYNERIA